MKNMKILWAVDSPFYPIHGGADRVVYHQTTLAAKNGADVYALCRDKKGERDKEESLEGVRIFSFFVKANSLLTNFIKSYRLGKKAFHQLLKKEGSFDFVFFHQPLIALSAQEFHLRKPFRKIYFFHSPFSSEFLIRNPGGWIKDWFYKKFLNVVEKRAIKGADLVVFDSHYMEKEAIRIHPYLEDLARSVIPLGVDLTRFSCKKETTQARQKLQLYPSVPMALTVRNLEPRMGLEALIHAWVKVVEKIPEAILLIGGEGSLGKYLAKVIEERNLQQNIFLLGYLPEEKLPLYYQAADVFILPTLELEGFGLVTIEALACGTPVLGTHVGAIPEVLNRLDSSLIFASRRPQMMAERIIQFFQKEEKKKFTPDVCRRYVEEHYSWQRHMAELEKLLMQMKRYRNG